MLNRVRLALTTVALVVTLLAGCLHMTWTRHTTRARDLPKLKLTPAQAPPWSKSGQRQFRRWKHRIHELRLRQHRKDHYHGRHRHRHAPLSSPANLGVTMSEAQFQSCVISRESGGNARAVNPASDAGGLYQFLPSTWAALGFAKAYPGGAQTAPVSVQNQAFYKAYAESGTSPWAPYDGC